MKILIVTQYYYPEQFQINDIAPELVRRGHSITVLTGLPNYPQGEIFQGYKDIQEEYIEGARVIRVKIHPRKGSSFHLIWNYVSFILNGDRAAKRIKEQYDIVFSYQLSPVTSLIPAITYKRRHGVPLLNYCLDIWPESALGHFSSEKALLYKWISGLSRSLYKQCDHIAVTSRPFIDYLSKTNGVERTRMSYIPQHANGDYLAMNLDAPLNNIADFMYAGNLGQGQRVDVAIQAAAEIKNLPFMLHIVGDGSYRSNLEELTKKLDIADKVVFYGNQKREAMPEYYRKADVLLITLRGDNFVGDTMPGKLQTYMACGKPILGAINGAAYETILQARCGNCVGAGDYIGLAQLMKDYIEHPKQYESCGKNAREYFKAHFTFNEYMDCLENRMKVMTE